MFIKQHNFHSGKYLLTLLIAMRALLEMSVTE